MHEPITENEQRKKIDFYPSHIYFDNNEDFSKAKKILDSHYFEYEAHPSIRQLNIKNKITIASILKLFDLEGIKYHKGDNKIPVSFEFFGMPYQE